MSDWDEGLENKIMKNYRFKFTARIIKVITAIFLLYAFYMMGVNIIADSMKWDRKHLYNISLMLDWKFPNVKTPMDPPVSAMDGLWTQRMEVPLYEQVGKEDYSTGSINMKKGLLPGSSQLQYEWETDTSNDYFGFYLPENPNSGKKYSPHESDSAWTTLEKVHEGTVAELAFSTTEFMKPIELQKTLENYDIQVLWMPLYTGEMKEFKAGYGSSGNDMQLTGVYGLSSGREHDKDYMSQSQMLLDSRHMGDLQDAMLDSMKNMLEKESERYYDSFLGLDHLQERYDYLKKEGFAVYGAVVTGPVKELLKLKEIEGIHGVQVGSMEYWNWDAY
ncbi:anti-sigma factor [Bacillus salacetis]|uniref:anti-sigma factor n=1 Tax=Bacillus salacetis TaxID=2315464 RepID=UPI001444204B|nr:anti-sigma factor [Bacillus salacetis]